MFQLPVSAHIRPSPLIASHRRTSPHIAHGPKGFPSPKEGVEHPIRIEDGSLLSSVLDGHVTPPAISYHHQAVDSLGVGFRATAWAEDGHVEAMERSSGWFVCLQWHPEDTAHVDPAQQRIYDAFVERALHRAEKRR